MASMTQAAPQDRQFVARDTPPYYYLAYGLTFRSEIALPELQLSGTTDADVTIYRQTSADMFAGSEPEAPTFEAGKASFLWDAVGGFVVTPNSIYVSQNDDVDDQLVAFPLLGPVLASLLHMRGLHVLHASAIDFEGHGIGLLGDKGAGKSTTAGVLISAGNRLLTDDLLAIFQAPGVPPRIAAGFPQLKLSETASQHLALRDADALGSVHPAIDKRQHRLTAGFSSSDVAAGRLYVLERGSDPMVVALSRPEALQAIIRFSYMTRFGSAALAGAAAADFFRQCARLADTVTVARLRVPDRLEDIHIIPDLIRDDLGKGSA